MFKKIWVNRKIKEEHIDILLKNKNWPTITQKKTTKGIAQTAYKISPTIKLQEEANEIYDTNVDWTQKEISIKAAMTNSFKTM